MNSKFLILIFALFIGVNSFAQDVKKYTTHIVKNGETLKTIAKKYDCKVKELKDLNPDVDEDNLVTNTTLVVPRLANSKTDVKDEKTKSDTIKYHTVEEGNTLFSIAKKYNVTLFALRDANNLKDNNITVGSKLIIPAAETFMVTPVHQKLGYYEVQKGDTKYSIAQKHNISVEELDNINPNQSAELKEHDVLWVPLIEKETKISEVSQSEQDTTYVYHVVKDKENVFRIAVLYDVSQEEIETLNPEAVKMLRPGMLLKIPGKKKDKLVTHFVDKGDTLYGIARKYNVSEADLYALNPTLKETGLKFDTTIYIKPKGYLTPLPQDKSINSSEPVRVSFLLPIMTDKNISYRVNSEDSKIRFIVTDFYLGAQLAIDKLKSEGLDIDYHVYDTKNSETAVKELAKIDAVKNSHLIIGPLYFENAVALADELKDVPIVYPLYSKKQDNAIRENLIKVGINNNDSKEVLYDYIYRRYTGQKIFTVTDQKDSNKIDADSFEQFMKGKNIKTERLEFGNIPTDSEALTIYKDSLNTKLNIENQHFIVLFSDAKNYNSDVLKLLAERNKVTPIRLFSLNYLENASQDVNALKELEWTFPEIQFENTKSTEAVNFKKAFNDKNFAYPGTFAFTGYDVTYDMIKRMSQGNFYINLQNRETNGLFQAFNYNRTYEPEFVNHGIMLLKLNKDLRYEQVSN